jgi:hypothetical protein
MMSKGFVGRRKRCPAMRWPAMLCLPVLAACVTPPASYYVAPTLPESEVATVVSVGSDAGFRIGQPSGAVAYLTAVNLRPVGADGGYPIKLKILPGMAYLAARCDLPAGAREPGTDKAAGFTGFATKIFELKLHKGKRYELHCSYANQARAHIWLEPAAEPRTRN